MRRGKARGIVLVLAGFLLTTVAGGCGNTGSVQTKTVSSASGYSITLVANPNAVPGNGPGSVIMATVRNQSGQLVNGLTVQFGTNLGVFPDAEGKEFLNMFGVTSNGVATVGLRAPKGVTIVGTAEVFAQVEDAVSMTRVTFF